MLDSLNSITTVVYNPYSKHPYFTTLRQNLNAISSNQSLGLWTTLVSLRKSTLARVLVSNSDSNSWNAVSPCGLLTAHSFGCFSFKSNGLPLHKTYLRISPVLFICESVHCQDPELTLARPTEPLLSLLTLFLFRKYYSSSLLDTQPRFAAMHRTSSITLPSKIVLG